jgi:hypothetical protein
MGPGRIVASIPALISALSAWLACRFRSRLEMELELIGLRHQVTVLHRQQPGRPRLCSLDRLVWAWLYRVWPRYLEVMVLLKPATVVPWHRQIFRLRAWAVPVRAKTVATETRKIDPPDVSCLL